MEEMPSLNMPVHRLKVAILPLGLTLLWARDPFRGNFNHLQVSSSHIALYTFQNIVALHNHQFIHGRIYFMTCRFQKIALKNTTIFLS